MQSTKKSTIYGLACAVLLFFVLSFPVNAIDLLDGNVTVSLSGDTGNATQTELTTNSLAYTVSGGNWLSKELTLTITNSTGKPATISFNYTASSYSSFTIAGDTKSGSGSYTSTLLDTSGTVTVTIKVARKGSASIRLYNIACEVAADTSSITFEYDGTMGSITVGGESVASGYVKEGVTVSDGVAVAATANSGYTFLGWVDLTENSDNCNMRLSASASDTIKPASDMTAKAVFVKNDGTSNAWFLVDNAKMTDDLDEATTLGTNIVLMHDGTLKAGTYEIPSGDTLLIPNSATDTGAFGGEPAIQLDGNITNNPANAFRTLTIPTGTAITCYGEINVNGHRSANGQPFNGHVIGDYGKIILGEESQTFSDPAEDNLIAQLTIGSGGTLYCYGYITGSGMVDVQSNGTVHELLQMADWPGGGNGTGWEGDNYNNLFLCTQYYVQNIEAPLKIACGATQYVEAVITVSLGSLGSVEIKFSAKFISASDGMFIMADDGYLLRIYDQQHDRMNYHFKGGSCTIGTLSMSGYGQNITTENSIMPITNNISVYIEDNATFNINKPVAILPGAEVIIEYDGIANIENSAIYIYDVNDWKGITNNAMSSYFNRVQEAINGGWAPDDVNTDPKTNPLPYVATLNSISPRATGYYYNPSNKGQGMSNPKPITTSGRVVVNGTLNIKTDGYVYTSSDSASEDKVITGTGTIVHNGSLATAEKTIESGTSSYIATVNFNNALGNLAGVGEMQPFTNGNTTYHGIVINDVNWWYITEANVDATCVEDGYTKYYCDDANSYLVVANGQLATGHTWGTDCICDVCTIFKFYASNVRLGNNLDMMFAFPKKGLPDTPTNYYVRTVRNYSDGSKEEIIFNYSAKYAVITRTKADGTQETENVYCGDSTWKLTTVEGVDCYFVTYSGFAAKEMCETIELTVCNPDGTAASDAWEDSIQLYAKRMLDKATDALTLDSDKDGVADITLDAKRMKYYTTQRTLIVDMLNYGAACQTFFAAQEGKTVAAEDLATAMISEYLKFGTQTDPLATNSNTSTNDYWVGSNVMADSNTQFVVGFSSNFKEGMYFTYEFENHWGKPVSKTIAYDDISSIDKMYHGLANLRLADARISITFKVYDASGNELAEWNDSVESYCARMIATHPDDADVYKSLLKFADSARAYLHYSEEAST